MKILFCGKTFPAAPALLERLLPEDEVLSCPAEDVAVMGVAVDVLVPLMHRLDADIIGKTSAGLIQQLGVGLEGVNIPAATARGILVCNVPGDVTPNADSTAEHAIFLMFGLARRVHECFRSFREGGWGIPLGTGLFGKTALIVGLGRVGKALAVRLRSLGMQVEAVRRNPAGQGGQRLGLARIGTLDNLLEMASRADFVISTVVLNDETRGVFDKRLFQAMKQTAFVVNVSRGPVVNEEHLIEALRKGTIAGAGLDVYSLEPVDPSNPLLSMSNVFATPHVAGATVQNYEGIGRIVAENITAFKQGKTPRFCQNPKATSG